MKNENPHYPFDSVYESFVYKSRYARWLEDENRRENWNETVGRLVSYYLDQYPSKTWTDGLSADLFDAIYNLEVMPSMRALMTAGPD